MCTHTREGFFEKILNEAGPNRETLNRIFQQIVGNDVVK